MMNEMIEITIVPLAVADSETGRARRDAALWAVVEALAPLPWTAPGAVATPLDPSDMPTVPIRVPVIRQARALPPPLPQVRPEQRRLEERKPASIAIEVFHPSWDAPVAINTSDMSTDGALLRGTPEVASGELVILSFRLPIDGFEIGCFGQVVRKVAARRGAEPQPGGIAIRFLELSPLERRRILDALRPVPARARRLPPAAAFDLVATA